MKTIICIFLSQSSEIIISIISDFAYNGKKLDPAGSAITIVAIYLDDNCVQRHLFYSHCFEWMNVFIRPKYLSKSMKSCDKLFCGDEAYA